MACFNSVEPFSVSLLRFPCALRYDDCIGHAFTRGTAERLCLFFKQNPAATSVVSHITNLPLVRHL